MPGCTRSIQLSRVAIGLPLLQLAAELFVTTYFTGRPVQPRPKRWDTRTSGGSATSAAGLRGGGLPWSPGVQCSRGLCGGTPGSAAGQPAQPRVYAAAGPESAASDFSESFGPAMASTPLVSRRSRGSRGGPSRERQLAGPPAPPRVNAGRPVCVKPSSSLVKRASSLPWSVGAAAGYAVDPPGNGHAQGRQLHCGITRGGPNALGLASLKHYGSFGQAMTSTPPGGQHSCGTQWATRGRSTWGRQSSRGPTRRRHHPPNGQHHHGGHSARQQVDDAAADSSGPPGVPQSEAPV
jgi:hypothetical protein